MRAFLLKSPHNPKKICEDIVDSETLWFFFILIGVPVLIGMVLKFFFGKAPPPKPDQEVSDELFDEIEHSSAPPRRRRKRSRNRTSSQE
jgi:hypothetical protein